MDEIRLTADGLAYAPRRRPATHRRSLVAAHAPFIGNGVELLKGFGYIVGAGLAGGLALSALRAPAAPRLVVDLISKPVVGGLLLIIALCFAAYGAWELLVVARQPDRDPEAVFRRMRTGAGAIVHVLVAITAGFGVYGAGRADFMPLTAQILVPTAGAWAILALGVGLMLAGAMQIYRAVSGELEESLGLPPKLDDDARQVLRIAQVGVIARGLALPLIGVFLAITAGQANPNEPIGLALSLEAALARPAGPYMLLFVASAAAIYGVAAVAVRALLRDASPKGA